MIQMQIVHFKATINAQYTLFYNLNAYILPVSLTYAVSSYLHYFYNLASDKSPSKPEKVVLLSNKPPCWMKCLSKLFPAKKTFNQPIQSKCLKGLWNLQCFLFPAPISFWRYISRKFTSFLQLFLRILQQE